jgi:Homeodomain-like domain
MANRLKMVNIQAVIGLLEQGWSYRRIARELGIDRETVARYDRLRKSKPAIVAPGSRVPEDPNAAISPPGSGQFMEDLVFLQASGRPPGRVSECEPFKDVINKKLDQCLSAQRMSVDDCGVGPSQLLEIIRYL